ncbi:hypothetical protein [Methylobacterium sp. J-076]|uniref:hypothetical protein n=1 Tax=Methylobacterium sp. J-076 TaxID=2836655 RepID=UPI001FBA7BB2|nr:hypothetical protein [Methylobacterium sp. J-076]MCJ2012156.1 hypothetical protein [Methylobacterium sp. J-076]
MLILFPTPRRIALLGLLLLSLVVLADWTARVELARAVNAALNDGTRAVVQITVAND